MSSSRRSTALPALLLAALTTQPALAATTELVSRNARGVAGSNPSNGSTIADDGQRVAFVSRAINLVRPDANGTIEDVFVFDRRARKVTLASVSSAGVQGNHISYSPIISGNGEVVAFVSNATNLVPGDHSQAPDVVVRDLAHGTTELVSVDSRGRQIQGGVSFLAAISATGRFVVFGTEAKNVALPGNTSGMPQVYLRDRQAHTTTLVSVGSGGRAGNGQSNGRAVSADGRHVLFDSIAANLVVGDTNRASDVFLRDTVKGTTTLISVGLRGAQANGGSSGDGLSADRRIVAFESNATDLTAQGGGGRGEIFVRDLKTGATKLVSVNRAGTPASYAVFGAISADGRVVSFVSGDSNLVASDTNNAVDVFVRDLAARVTQRVSLAASGAEALGESVTDTNRNLSGDGRVVTFSSAAAGLVPADPNHREDVFVRVR